MFHVRANTQKNRLYLELSGYMLVPEIQEAAAAVEREVQKLRPGFAVVNDISLFKPANDEGAQIILATQKAVAARGMGTVVRIVSAVSRLQFDRTSREAGYKALVAENQREADLLLDAAG